MVGVVNLFKFDELDDIEREIIICLGDDIRYPTFDIMSNMKNRIDIYKENFKNKITESEFEEYLDKLYLKGLITFNPTSIGMINNNLSESIDELEKKKNLEFQWRSQGPYARLTDKKERAISGEAVLNKLVQEEFFNNYHNILKEYNKLKETSEKLEKNFNSVNNKYIEIMAVFISIFTFIISNVNVFVNLKDKSFIDIISGDLMVNGIILFSLLCLFLLLKTTILNEKIASKTYFLFSFPLIIIFVGFFVKAWFS